MTLGEDSSLIVKGYPPENLSLVGNLVLAALRRTPERTEKDGNKKLSAAGQTMKLCTWDNERSLMMLQSLIQAISGCPGLACWMLYPPVRVCAYTLRSQGDGPLHPGTLVDHRFEVQQLAGEGGMGSVYRACDTQTHQLVALKTLRAVQGDAAARFLREARVLAELSHPGIVRYVAHGVSEHGQAYLGPWSG